MKMNDTTARTTITVRADTYEMLDDRRTGTWDEFLRSIIQSHSPPARHSDRGGDAEEPLTADHIDDIAAAVASRTAEEIEGRFRR